MRDEEAFLNRRWSAWQRLETLVLKAEGHQGRMPGHEFLELVKLYRQTSADLAMMTTRSSNRSVVDYLDILVARAYGVVYRAPRFDLKTLIRDAAFSAADTVRRRQVFVWFAIFVTLVGAVWAPFALTIRPDLRSRIISPEMEPNFSYWKQRQHQPRGLDGDAQMMVMYATNNPRVGLVTAALGYVTGGLYSSYILFQNGQMVGALSYDMNTVGGLGFLWTSILPHGVSELGGIFIAAAGGYLMGWTLLCPGRKSRWAALKSVNRDATVLIVTGLVMIFMAAPIEGYFSFNPDVPQPVKLVFGVGALVAWSAFFMGYGKGRTRSVS
jgi:uncharacterized membrane protein SpoIIM required for sporulation